MRTGAIFARGSCRALKWMALFGVIFALGSGQAIAQAVFQGSDFTPGTTTVTLKFDALVWGSPPASAFTVMVDADGTGPGTAAANAITGITSISQGSLDDEIVLTVTTAIKSLSTVTASYTPATPATATNQIFNAGGTASVANAAIAVAERGFHTATPDNCPH